MRKIMSQMSGARMQWAILMGTATAVLVALALLSAPPTRAQGGGNSDSDESKIKTGFDIAPVELDLRGKNPALVGLGSYIVNAQAICGDCHTWPQFAPGGNPFLGEPEEINTAGYLAGGRLQGGRFVSRNLTPDPDTGLPAGLTFEEFALVLRTGIDLDQRPPHVPDLEGDRLQIMPWPWFNKMTDRDLRAVYEYLRAIPNLP